MPLLEDNDLRTEHFRALKWSLQALAAAASDQLVLFPDRTVKADGLAADFDHSAAAVREHYEGDLAPAQVDALDAIDRKLSTMSRDGAEFGAELWTEAALRSSEHWGQVRSLAAAALAAFGWPADHLGQHPETRGA